MENENQNEEPAGIKEQDETPDPHSTGAQKQPGQEEQQGSTEAQKQTDSAGTEQQYQQNSQNQPYGEGTGQQGSYYQQNNPYQQYGAGTNQQNGPYQQYSEGANQQNYQQYSEGANRQNYQQYGEGANRQNYQQYSQYQQYGSGTQYGDYQKAGQGAYSSGFGITSMILGILSLMLFCTCINIPLAVGAVVFGILQLGRGPQGKGMAIAGIVTAALSVVAFFAMAVLMWRPFMQYYQEGLPNTQRPRYEYEYDYDDGMEDFFDFFDGRDHF